MSSTPKLENFDLPSSAIFFCFSPENGPLNAPNSWFCKIENQQKKSPGNYCMSKDHFPYISFYNSPFKNTCSKYVCHMLGLYSLPTVVLGRRERRRAEIWMFKHVTKSPLGTRKFQFVALSGLRLVHHSKKLCWAQNTIAYHYYIYESSIMNVWTHWFPTH